MILGKLQRAHPTLRGHFAPAYLVESNKVRAYLFFIYGPLISNVTLVQKVTLQHVCRGQILTDSRQTNNRRDKP